MRLKLDISLLTKKQIRTARSWVVVAIVGLLCAQSFVSYLIIYSLDTHSDFQAGYSQTGQKLENLHEKTREGLLAFLDYGQKPDQKKQTAPVQLSISFNLFFQDLYLKLPGREVVEIENSNDFAYNAKYTHLHFEEIPHPPQFM